MKQVVYEVQLGLKEVSPPCYKESPTDPWEDPCASVALQVMIRNDHLMDQQTLKVLPRWLAGGENFGCRSCFCFQRWQKWRGIKEGKEGWKVFDISGDLLMKTLGEFKIQV